MRKPAAAAGSAAFFVVAPGTVAGLGPWLITGWEVPGPPWRTVLGALMILIGMVPPVHAFMQFAQAGGTPMPITPTDRLVITGFNRFVRNPMYLGLIIAILGQAVLFADVRLVLYAAVFWLATATFVRVYEEPTLARVRAWIPTPAVRSPRRRHG